MSLISILAVVLFFLGIVAFLRDGIPVQPPPTWKWFSVGCALIAASVMLLIWGH